MVCLSVARACLVARLLTILVAAKNQAASNPEKTIFDIKRLIGRKFSEKDVQNECVASQPHIPEQDSRILTM